MSLTVKGLGLVFVWLASIALGSSEFGVLALALSCFGLAVKIAGLGLPTTIQRFLSGDQGAGTSKVFGTISTFSLVTGVAAGLLLFLLAPTLASRVFDEPRLVGPLRILAGGVAILTPYNVARARLRSQELVREHAIGETVRAAGKVAFLGLALLIARSATAGALSVPISGLVAGAVVLLFLRRAEIQGAGSDFKRHLGGLLRYSLPLTFVGLSYFLATQADRLMLGLLGTSSQVGVYTVASSLSQASTVVHGALVMAFMPLASEAYRQSALDRLRDTYRMVGKWAGTFNAVVLLVFVAAGPVILGYFGADFSTAGAYGVLLLLAGLMFLITWIGPTAAVLQMSDGQYIELGNTVVFVVVNILLNLVLIPAYGILGAAGATIVSGLTRNLLQVVEIRMRLGFWPVDRDDLGLLLVTGLGLTVGVTIPEPWIRGGAAIATVLLVTLLFSRRLTQEERDTIMNMVKRRMAGRENGV